MATPSSLLASPESPAKKCTKSTIIQRMRSSRGAVLFVCSLALFTDMLVYGIVIPILPAILRSIGIPPEQETTCSTILFSAYALGLFFATPVFGIFSDKTKNRMTPMLLGLAGLALTTVLFAISSHFYILLFARFLQGVASAASWVVGMALVADTFPITQLGSALGFVMSFYTVGFICGPMISGYAATYISLRAPFYICVIFALLDFFCRILLKPPQKHQAEQEPSSPIETPLPPSQEPQPPLPSLSGGGISILLKRLLSSNMMTILCHFEIFILCFGVVLEAASISIIESLIAEYLERYFGLSLSECSNTLLFFILPNALFPLVVGRLTDTCSRSRLIIIGTIFHAAASPFVALATTLTQFRIAAVVFGLSSSFMITPIMPQLTFLLGSYGKHNTSYAKLYSLFLIATSLGMVLGPIIAGLLMSSTSFLAVMLLFPISSCLLFLPIFMITTIYKERDRFRLANLSNNNSSFSFFRELFIPLPEPVYSKAFIS